MVLDDFPPDKGPEREAKIIECVKSGRCEYKFVELVSEYKGHTAKFLVFEDALKIDGIRVNVTATTQQQIADLLHCVLPTAKLYDLMWHVCQYRTTPHTQTIISTTKAMIDHSQRIDKEISDKNYPEALRSTVGKIWIIDNSLASKPGKACNYGWHFASGSSCQGVNGEVNVSLLKNPATGVYWYLIQGRGWAHNAAHSDYSQICVLVSRQCWVDGNEMDIYDVLGNPELAPLVNHDGVLKVLRQPDVPVLDPIVGLQIQPVPKPEPEPVLPERIDVKPPDPPKTTEEPPSGIWALLMSIFKLFGRS